MTGADEQGSRCTTSAEFPPTAVAVREARHLAIEAAGGDQASSAHLALAVSELATNAVIHAGTPFVVTIVRRGRSVRVIVSDGSVERPEVQAPGPAAATGRGLRLLANVVDRWGVEVTPDGKDVWFEMRLDGGIDVISGAERPPRSGPSGAGRCTGAAGCSCTAVTG